MNMHDIYDIIQELNLENGSKYKIDVLKKYTDNELLKRVLAMTYDHVKYNYGIGKKTLGKISCCTVNESNISIDCALDILENSFCTRDVTGNAAINRIQEVFSALNDKDRFVIARIIERDLKINLGKTQINKVFKGLITKPIYMRCDVYNKKSIKNVKFPSIVQLKADGTYREFSVEDGNVTIRSRSGESYEYPVLERVLSTLPNGVYVGELTVRGVDDRAKGNGLINSDNPPHNDIIAELWDYISHDEYEKAGRKDRKKPCETPYKDRWSELNDILYNKQSDHIKLIPSYVVSTLQEAIKKTSEWMNEGYEGAILKDLSGVFKDGTSKHQLKIKLEISAEMRVTGFHEGTPGTKREGKVGSIEFSNDEGTIKGRCSGFNDKELDYFTDNQDELIGKIIEVQFNDLSKGANNDYYALSHPRFIQFRDDKDETDTLEKVLELREMAITLG
jgi:hypothetical protein